MRLGRVAEEDERGVRVLAVVQVSAAGTGVRSLAVRARLPKVNEVRLLEVDGVRMLAVGEVGAVSEDRVDGR